MSRRTGRITLHSDRLRWEPLEVKGAVGYAFAKTLSRDEETGARTLLVKYEPGFKAPATVAEWCADTYTLEGGMRSGDRTYNKNTYHYRPAGTPIGAIDSPEGIVRIIFTADTKDPSKSSSEEVFIQNVVTDVPPDPRSAFEQAPAEGPEAESAATMWNTGHIPVNPTAVHVKHGEIGETWRKILRLDPLQESAFRVQRSLKVGARQAVDIIHVHPFFEEAFFIVGENEDYDDMIDGHWRWVPGSYVCRQPGEGPHGDAMKLDDNYYMIVRQGWTPDEKKAAEWLAAQKELPMRRSVDFVE